MVIEKVEEFFMGDGEDGGEAIFNNFAEKHHHLFEGDFANFEDNDNKNVKHVQHCTCQLRGRSNRQQ